MSGKFCAPNEVTSHFGAGLYLLSDQDLSLFGRSARIPFAVGARLTQWGRTAMQTERAASGEFGYVGFVKEVTCDVWGWIC